MNSMSTWFGQCPMTNTLKKGAMKIAQVKDRHVGRKVRPLKFYSR